MWPMYNATVTKLTIITPGTMVLRVELDGDPFPFEPGQYTVLGLFRSAPRFVGTSLDSAELQEKPENYLLRRAYSITSNSRSRELEFVITLIRSGALTPRLFSLEEGSRLYVEPKATGVFTLKTSSGNRDLLLVATGSAVAPYLSMLQSDFPQNPEHQYVVIHAAATSWDLAFRSQLAAFAERSKHFVYLPTITEAERDNTWNGLIGSVESLLQGGEIEELIGMPISPDRFDVFLSGSPVMIDAVTPELVDRGFTAGEPNHPETNIHAERYW